MMLTEDEFNLVYNYFVTRNLSGQDLAAHRILLRLEAIKQRKETDNDNR